MSAFLTAILPDATNLGLGRMATASYAVGFDKLIWTADAYMWSLAIIDARAR